MRKITPKGFACVVSLFVSTTIVVIGVAEGLDYVQGDTTIITTLPLDLSYYRCRINELCVYRSIQSNFDSFAGYHSSRFTFVFDLVG